MLLRTVLRTSSASVGLPLAVVFVLFALSDDLTNFVTDHYWPSAIGSATFALPFIATGCAGLGAWEGARLAKGQVFTQTTVRSALAIVAPVLLPVVMTGLIATLTAVALTASASGATPSLSETSVVLVEVLLLSANTALGYLVGRRWPAVISVPVTLIAAFIANAYPVSWDILWIRHLVGGGLHNCCAVDQMLDTRAMWSAGVFALTLALAAGLVIQFPRRKDVLVASLALAVAGTATASWFAHNLTADPVRDRPTAALICDDAASTRVCLWPEVRDSAMVRSEIERALTRLKTVGVGAPPVFTMAASPAKEQAKLGILPDATPAEIPVAVVAGILPQPPACADTQDYPAGAAREPLAAWLMLTAGVSSDIVSGQVAPEAAALARTVTQQPNKLQLAWYKTNRVAIQSCTTKPELSVEGAR